MREDRDRESELVRVRQGMRDRESKRVVREGERERGREGENKRH